MRGTICGYLVDDLLLVAEVMKRNPALIDDIRHGYIAGFKDGYNAAVKDFNDAIIKRMSTPQSFTRVIDEFDKSKVSFDIPKIQPCESREEMYARMHMQMATLPKEEEFVAIKIKAEGEV